MVKWLTAYYRVLVIMSVNKITQTRNVFKKRQGNAADDCYKQLAIL